MTRVKADNMTAKAYGRGMTDSDHKSSWLKLESVIDPALISQHVITVKTFHTANFSGLVAIPSF